MGQSKLNLEFKSHQTIFLLQKGQRIESINHVKEKKPRFMTS